MTVPATASTGSMHELFHTAFEEAPIGMCLVGPDGRFLQVNAAICRMMGYEAAELLRLTVGAVTHPDDRADNLVLFNRLVDGSLDRYEIRKHNVRRDGSPIPLLVTVNAVRDADRRLLYIVAQLQDLTRQLEAERALREAEQAHRARLEHQARHDSLTGLPNRRELLRRLESELAQVARGERGAAVLFCDLDNFKTVNDTHGHAVGDELLVGVAHRLLRALPAGDPVSRFGGDEFVVLASGVASAGDAVAAGERFARLFDEPFTVEGRTFDVTASVGVAHVPAGASDDAHTLLRNADMAMYRAKHAGRNRVVGFTETLRRELLERVELEGQLRLALARREFVCHYQPIVDLVHRRVHKAEALVRWNHPTRGLLSPGTFLPAVERGALSTALGDLVLEGAVERAGAWRRRGVDVTMAVNIVAEQLVPALPPALERLLATHGVAPDRLCLELTEGAVLGAHGEGVATLHALAGLGVRLAIDDFGTGYSSFSYLRDLPVHAVKLDISFIARLLSDDRDARVVAGMIRLAHELGLTVVAEGVEQEAQAVRLAELGCDAAQGFLFARPSADPFAAAGGAEAVRAG